MHPHLVFQLLDKMTALDTSRSITMEQTVSYMWSTSDEDADIDADINDDIDGGKQAGEAGLTESTRKEIPPT